MATSQRKRQLGRLPFEIFFTCDFRYLNLVEVTGIEPAYRVSAAEQPGGLFRCDTLAERLATARSRKPRQRSEAQLSRSRDRRENEM